MKNSRKKIQFTDVQRILLGFLSAILVGSVLLMLPFASADGRMTFFVDALFTATTSVCVTGLTVVDTFSHWSLFGQIVILLLIQLGGLGIISFITGTIMLMRKRVSLSDRILLENAFNLDTISNIPQFMKRVFLGTLIVEFVGALLCLPVFVPEYGAKGIYVSVFHSISAFCNAGLDILGPNSLIPYYNNPWLLFVTMLLIILGGIGFIVWFDVLSVISRKRKKEIAKHQFFRHLRLHSKLTLLLTAILILVGFAVFLGVEWANPDTFGTMNVGDKIVNALFQSVTTRTAGFTTIDQSALHPGSSLVTLVLMFIGGSSVGTAGGVKTTTVLMLILATVSVIRGKSQIQAFHRTIPGALVKRAISIVFIAFSALFVSTVLMTFFVDAPFMNVIYEMVSALGTVGLTAGISGIAGVAGKILLILCMYLGRIGPISLALAFQRKHSRRDLDYPEQNITIG